jgi:asparagine synthase (glutamine-hydrolysing)
MCGIAAIYAHSEDADPVNTRELLDIRDHMSNRGPDGVGLWLGAKERIGLAHRRLSIIDLRDIALQPMAAREGRLQIIFNGEIYNYRSLRDELEKKGYHFASNSDTEVLLHLYAEKGQDMVQYLRGMYAFVLWDENRQGLFLARDPFGIKPLYFHDDGHTFRCASQVKALLAGNGFEARIEPAGHVGFFIWGSIPEPYTLYKIVFSLPAGHSLWVDGQGMRDPHKFFDPAEELANAPASAPNEKADLEILHSALRDSIRHHLIADVSVSVFLSAGLDSSTIAALAAENSSLIQTITLGFKEYENLHDDEVPLARKTAEYYNCQHAVHYIQHADFDAEKEQILASMDSPSVDGVNTYFVAQAAAKAGLKVALSGLGGDELLGGYPSFKDIPRLVRLAHFPASLPGFGKAFRYLSTPILKHFTSPKYGGLFEYGGSHGGAYLIRRGLFMPWELPDVMDADLAREGWETLQPFLRADDMLANIRGDHARVSVLELTRYMRNTLLRDSDWAGMAHSLEIRTPLIDIDLYRALAPILAREKVTLTKQAMALAPKKPLPSELFNRPKSGFTVPIRQWVENDGQSSHRRGLRGWAMNVYRSFGFSHTTTLPRRKRILSLVPDAYGGNGGIAKYNRDLLSAASTHPDISSIMVLPRTKSSHHEINDLPLNLYFDPRSMGGKWNYTRELFNRLRDYRYLDMILCGHINLLPLAYLAARLKGASLWCTFYGIEAWRPHANSLTNRILRQLDGFISISRLTRERLVAHSGISTDIGFILPNSIDTTIFSPGTIQPALRERYGVQGKKVLMTLGRLASEEQYKGFDEVLNCLPSLIQQIPELVYLIVGTGSDISRLKHKVTNLGLEKHVIFTGFIAEEEKVDHYRMADVYVMPSRGEGFGFVLLEAMACGIPTIGSTLDGGREALREGQLGILVDPDNPQQIEDAILQALADGDRQVPAGLEYFHLRSFRKRTVEFLDHALDKAK